MLNIKIRKSFVAVGTLLVAIAATGCVDPADRVSEHVASSEAYLAAGELDKARVEARAALKIEPKNTQARFILANIAQAQQKFRDMVGHLLVIVDDDPDFVPARVKLGMVYFEARQTEKAAEQAAAAMALAPDIAGVRLLNSYVLQLQGDNEQALAEAREALRLDPALAPALVQAGGLMALQDREAALEFLAEGVTNLQLPQAQQARLLQASILQGMGRLDEAEARLLAMLQDYPGNASTYRAELLRMYLEAGRDAEAEQLLRDAIAEAPEDHERKVELVRFLAAQQSPEAAETFLKDAIAGAPDEPLLQLALARLYEDLERWADARHWYRQVSLAVPKSAEGLAASDRLAGLLISNGDLDQARAVVDAVLEAVPNDPPALTYRAAFSFADERYEDAIADLRVALRGAPESQRALLLMARSYLRTGEAVLAQDAYRKVLDTNPAHPAASRELSALLLAGGQPEDAEEVLRARLAGDAEDVVARERLVRALLSQGDLVAAEQVAKELAAADPGGGRGDVALGQVYQAQASTVDAIDAYRKALDRNPDSGDALDGLVRALVRSDRAAEARDFLQDFLAERPERIDARLLLGAVLGVLGDRPAARAELEKIIEARPEALGTYVELASLYPDDPDERIAIFRRGLEANPGNPQLSHLLASHYKAKGRVDEAVATYEAVLAADPSNNISVNNLAALLLYYRDDEASLNRALELAQRFEGTNNALLADTLGWAYYRTGNPQRAVRYLEIAASADNSLPESRYHLGMAYLATENRVGARQELERALDQAGDGEFVGIEEARQTLATLENS